MCREQRSVCFALKESIKIRLGNQDAQIARLGLRSRLQDSQLVCCVKRAAMSQPMPVWLVRLAAMVLPKHSLGCQHALDVEMACTLTRLDFRYASCVLKERSPTPAASPSAFSVLWEAPNLRTDKPHAIFV